MKTLLTGAAAIFLLLPCGRTQTIQSESRLVLIDSIATGRKGVYVEDLTRKDFKVWEDGREQALTTFSFQANPARAGDQKRRLVLFFDNSTATPETQRAARNAAVKFIEANAKPDRLIAIVEFENAMRIAQDFTDDVDRLKAVAGRGGLSVALAASPSTGPAGAVTNSYSTRASTAALRDMAAWLGKLPGRKTVVLLSGGFSSIPGELDSVIDACNRADVAVYPVEVAGMDNAANTPAGLGSVPRRGREAADPAREETSVRSPVEVLTAFAGGTGGFLISHTNDLFAGLQRIGKEQDEYYTIGYVPAKELKPGACHSIRVKVDRGGVDLRYRTSYCDAKSADVLSGTPAQRDLEARLTTNVAPTVRASVQAPFFYTSANTARVNVALDVPGSGVKFTPDKGKFVATVNLIGVAYLPDGGVAARFSDSAKLTLNGKKEVEAFAAKPWRYEKQFEVASGTVNLKLAFSSSPDSFGRVETPLNVDEWTPSKFSLSGLALSNSVHPAGSEAAADRVAMIVNGIEVVASGNNHFRTSDKAFIYGEIYEPDPAQALGVHMVLMDSKSGAVAKDMGVSPLKGRSAPGKPAVPMGLILPTAELAPGSYVAQVTALDASGNEATRKIAFDLER